MKKSEIYKRVIFDVILTSNGNADDECFEKLRLLFEEYNHALYFEKNPVENEVSEDV